MMNKSGVRLAIAFVALLLLGSGVLLAGCGGNEEAPAEPTAADAAPPPADNPTPESSPTAVPDEAPPEGEGAPAEILAAGGEEVYAAECAECHGEQGEGLVGPALLGGANLAAYNTARGLYDYVHLAMPQDAPGSLTDQQYLEVVAFMLLENAVVESDTSLSLEGLSDIPLQ